MAAKRRAHGEGSITKRADGRWMARIDLGYVNGKRKRKCIYGATKAEVVGKLRATQHQHDHGVNIAPERITVVAFLERWLADVVAQRCRATTLEMYRLSVRRIVAHLPHMPLSKLGVVHVQQMLAALAAADYAPATVDRARDVLINALNTAVTWDLVPRNVAALSEPPKVERYRAQTITLAQMQHLLAVVATLPPVLRYLHSLVRLGLLGLRRGEVLGLRWQDLNWQERTFAVVMNLQRIDGTLTLVPPKSSDSLRTVPLPASLATVLHEHRTHQLEARLWAGSAWQDHDLLFCTRHGKPLSPNNVLDDWRSLLKHAELPPMRFHDLRHSFATLLLKRRVPAKVVQELLGHSDPRVTTQIYQHVVADDRVDAIDQLDSWLQENAG